MEVDYGSADKHEVDYDSIDNALEVKKQNSPQMQEVTISATNTFYKRPYLVPKEPTLANVGCGLENELIIPKIKGLKYTVVRTKDKIVVTVSALENYKIVEGAQVKWEYPLRAEACDPPLTGDDSMSMILGLLLVGVSAALGYGRIIYRRNN